MRFLPFPVPGVLTVAPNLVTNGDFETNTDGWATFGSNTVARSTAQSKSGSASLLFTYQNNSTFAVYAATLTAVAHSASAWIWVPASYDGPGIIFGFLAFTGGTGTPTVAVNMNRRDQWQRVVVNNYTPNGADLTGSIGFTQQTSAPSAGATLYLDGVRVVRV